MLPNDGKLRPIDWYQKTYIKISWNYPFKKWYLHWLCIPWHTAIKDHRDNHGPQDQQSSDIILIIWRVILKWSTANLLMLKGQCHSVEFAKILEFFKMHAVSLIPHAWCMQCHWYRMHGVIDTACTKIFSNNLKSCAKQGCYEKKCMRCQWHRMHDVSSVLTPHTKYDTACTIDERFERPWQPLNGISIKNIQYSIGQKTCADKKLARIFLSPWQNMKSKYFVLHFLPKLSYDILFSRGYCKNRFFKHSSIFSFANITSIFASWIQFTEIALRH
jgi:hypothetical protein